MQGTRGAERERERERAEPFDEDAQILAVVRERLISAGLTGAAFEMFMTQLGGLTRAEVQAHLDIRESTYQKHRREVIRVAYVLGYEGDPNALAIGLLRDAMRVLRRPPISGRRRRKEQ